jgi:hypothetical protein
MWKMIAESTHMQAQNLSLSHYQQQDRKIGSRMIDSHAYQANNQELHIASLFFPRARCDPISNFIKIELSCIALGSILDANINSGWKMHFRIGVIKCFLLIGLTYKTKLLPHMASYLLSSPVHYIRCFHSQFQVSNFATRLCVSAPYLVPRPFTHFHYGFKMIMVFLNLFLQHQWWLFYRIL